MTGGKRLSEEERKRIYNDLDILVPVLESLGLAMTAKKMREDALILERDDEPEYCTCGHKHGMRNADIWACKDCGKSVKGE